VLDCRAVTEHQSPVSSVSRHRPSGGPVPVPTAPGATSVAPQADRALKGIRNPVYDTAP